MTGLTAPAVQVSDLSVSYGRRRIVDGLELELGAGVHGLLGPNGTGKTTLIRVLATIMRPNRGEVRLLGQRTDRPSAQHSVRRRLGYLPQDFGYYPRFTVREFVEYFAWLKEVPRDRIATAVDRALERVDLTSASGTRMRKLSGGMLRRAGIAQALVNDPDLLLLDEPTAGLDPEQRVALRAVLRHIGIDSCVLISTHLVDDVAVGCTRVMVMSDGRIVFNDTPQELAAMGTRMPGAVGDSPMERGYTSVLEQARGRALVTGGGA